VGAKSSTREWGLLPADVRALVLKREWNNEAGLKSRLLNRKPFPVRVGLKPPAGHSAIADMAHFQKFVAEWEAYSPQKNVQWESRRYRALAEQRLPVFFTLENMAELFAFIGPQALERSEKWTKNMAPLLSVSEALYPPLVKHLKTLESLHVSDTELLASLIKQLSFKMGEGLYLRALPLMGVDTKFLEIYLPLVSDFLDVLHEGEITDSGGLHAWLGCLENPKGWLTIRPLCDEAKVKMAGFPVMQLHSDVLRKHALPAKNILVLENIQSGLGLPPLKDTIAVFGGGKNVSWIDAHWLTSKRVAYWGDIDSWGFAILSDVRSKLPSVKAMMMDADTLGQHEERMVAEPEFLEKRPAFLTDAEAQIFSDLKTGKYPGSRLEQERLSPDYIRNRLEAWATGS